MPKRITITGTKGKTTVATVLAGVLGQEYNDVLRVDTKGHYLNGEQIGTLADSKKIYGLVPTVAPGRFLNVLDGLHDSIAVMEASLGCSSLSGLGYSVHHVGVFLNVFEDHMGSSKRLESKKDIQRAKEFVFERLIATNGAAVFNADDGYTVDALGALRPHAKPLLIGFGVDFKEMDMGKHLAEGGVAVTLRDSLVVVLTEGEEQAVLDSRLVSWTFNGDFRPSIYNLLAVCAVIYGLYSRSGKEVPSSLWSRLESYNMPKDEGRLTLLESEGGVKILADYAHEKYSLKQVGELARSLAGNNGNTYGVLRLAYDRTDELIDDTAKYISESFDEFVIYDKIDGHYRQPEVRPEGARFTQKVGYISSRFSGALSSCGASVKRIIREDHAIEHVASRAKKGDVVVVIVNDDIDRSLRFIKSTFGVADEN